MIKLNQALQAVLETEYSFDKKIEILNTVISEAIESSITILIQKYKKPVLLWLDDVRNPYIHQIALDILKENNYIDYEIKWVQTYQEFVQYITKMGLPDAIAFDHDLGDDFDGYDCAKWLIEYYMENKNKKFVQYSSHSYNPTGKTNILTLLNNYARTHSSSL